ncbi:glycosyltransferase family 4 protein [Halarcobacter ebronensis]|uniref:Glycosyl transferase n=1 Tax=Halarcobacter ebronensis TaxID=1462615 RepID=A0A4Q1AW58_9BACT|nr:glycosyltransferase family 4 protein [Halarcobacter ebronensis]QKF81089.1 glycosyltransferase, family 1 [Halarcobacter ebronensis]RXK06394.1 hypothetical protein CRV07_06795 [Halarcobacter ebronensis]
MKILFIKEQRTKSGIEGSAKNVFYRCIELNKRNIPYLVLYNAKDEFYTLMLENNVNVKYVNFPSMSIKSIFKIREVKKRIQDIIEEEKIIHIHVHFPYLLSFLDKKWNIPITIHHHNAFNENKILEFFNIKEILYPKKVLKNLYNKLIGFDFSKADRCIAVSYAAKQTASFKYGMKSDKIDVVYNGITQINENNYKSLKKELGYNDSDILILSVGRVTKAKGVEDFCEVAKYFSNKTNYKFIFVGGYNDINYYNSIIEKYNKYVNFLGLRKDVFNLYKTSDIFLFLTHREACPNVIIEAMNFSLPTIGWDVVGVNELVKNDLNGLICKFGDIKSICDSLEKVINDKKLYDIYSKNSLLEAKKYTIEENTDKILAIFKSLEK